MVFCSIPSFNGGFGKAISTAPPWSVVLLWYSTLVVYLPTNSEAYRTHNRNRFVWDCTWNTPSLSICKSNVISTEGLFCYNNMHTLWSNSWGNFSEVSNQVVWCEYFVRLVGLFLTWYTGIQQCNGKCWLTPSYDTALYNPIGLLVS